MDKIKQINEYRNKLAELEKQLAAERSSKLKGLHKELGFASTADLISALRSISGTRAPKVAPAKKSKGRRKRAVITDATRKQVGDLVKAGKTGAEIAKAVGISLPSVHNIKAALGLVKGQGKK